MVDKLVIKRSEWTGFMYSCPDSEQAKEFFRDLGAPMLYISETGKRYQCCLGHLETAEGVPDSDLFNKGLPAISDRNNFSKDEFLDPRDLRTKAMWKAVELNDSTRMTLADKETALIKLFAENGITLSFVD